MVNAFHGRQTIAQGIHGAFAFEYADAAARNAAGPFQDYDLYKLALQQDTNEVWILTDPSGPTWELFAVIGSTGAVDSVFERTGAVVAVSGDYDSDLVDNASTVAGITVSDALETLQGLIVGGGGGTVTGPDTTTDNAIARWDGTDGYSIQNSAIIIDDSDNITGINDLSVGGNITVVGTVDGRDVSVDGAALDSHIADSTIHFTLEDIGLDGYALDSDLQSHIGDTTIHFTPESLGLDGYVLTVDFNNHTNDSSIHFTAESLGLDGYALDIDLQNHITDTANPHSTDIGNLGSGTLAELNAIITDATLDDSGDPRTPTAHASTHESGGSDEIDGYNVAITYSPINYTSPVNDIIGEHIAAIDNALSNVSGAVTSVFGRTGDVIAVSGDYDSDLVDNVSAVMGSSVSDALEHLNSLIIGGGGGTVSGPDTTTDNAIARWSGTDGYTIQNSGIIIDDSDNITGVTTLNGVVVESHASRHENGGADEIEISNMGTSETDTSLVLKPDGVGGISWVADSTASLDGYVFETRTITAGAGLIGGGDLSADRTIDVAANVDGSIVVNANDIQVGVISDAQHGNLSGGLLHDLASESTAGFLSSDGYITLNSLDNIYLRLDGFLPMEGDLDMDGYVINNILNASFVPVANGDAPPWQEGVIYYDSNEYAFTAYNDQSDVALQIGSEFYVRVVNTSGSTIPNGSAVYVSGVQGNRPAIALAIATSTITARAIGLVTHSIDNNQEGWVTILGTVHTDTSGFTPALPLYVSETVAGGLQQSQVTGENKSWFVGIPLNSTNNGRILVRPTSPDTIQNLFDVRDGSPNDGYYLRGDGSFWSAYEFAPDVIDAINNNLAVIDGYNLGFVYSPSNYGTPLNDVLGEHIAAIDAALANAGAVTSVFGRTGDVVAVSGDYDSDLVDNASAVSGITVSDALETLQGLIVGGGTVSGPDTTTDNAIARWDGTDGYTIQNSGVIIDDSDNITGVTTLNGVTVETHASRHENGGADEIDGYQLALSYTPVNYNAPTNDVIGEHIASIDDALANSNSANVINWVYNKVGGVTGSVIIPPSENSFSTNMGFLIPSDKTYELLGIIFSCGSGSASAATNASVRVSRYAVPNATQYTVSSGTTVTSNNILTVGASQASQFYVNEETTLDSPLLLVGGDMLFVEVISNLWSFTDVQVVLQVREWSAGTEGGRVVSISSNYTMDVNDILVLADTSSGSITVTLPDPSDTSIGIDYVVHKTSNDAFTITLDSPSGLINGENTQTFSSPQDSVVLTSDGVNWFVR